MCNAASPFNKMIRVYRIACVDAYSMIFMFFELFPAFTYVQCGKSF